MSACQFEFALEAEPDALLGALRADFARFGGALSSDGDAASFGEFSLPTPLGTFSGVWEVAAAGPGHCHVRIDVDEKPFFIPCSAIEEHLSRRLNKAAAGA